AECFSHRSSILLVSDNKLRRKVMARTILLLQGSNLPANCQQYAGSDRVCGCKECSWHVISVLAVCIRKVATVATPDTLLRWLGILAYRGSPSKAGPPHGCNCGTKYLT